MRELFGIPIADLALVLSVAFGASIGVVAIAALRNRVFLRLGVRNVGRRRSRTVLIVVGLMLGTALISAALNTGDTLSHTIRSSVLRSLGSTDEVVALKGVQIVNVMPGAVIDYFDESRYDGVRTAAEGTGLVDGTAPAIVETVAVQDTTSRQTESTVGLFATDPARMAGFGEIERDGGGLASLGDLAPGEVYLNAKGADKLDAHAGDELTVFGGGKLTTVRVRDIVRYRGGGTDGAGIIARLREGQQIVGREGKINFILVSNNGGMLSGVSRTDAVVEAMKPAVDAAGLEIQPAKQDAVKMADEMGASMIVLFTTFGTFSIAAGILLIFLIFVMLAGERKTEMGIARAMGTQRGNLVQMFLFEGVAYDLAAAAVGALLGVAVAYVMVFVMAQALSNFGVTLEHDLRPESLVIAYTLGVLLTLFVVTASAWQVSVLNITTAIRNLPDPLGRRGGRGRWVMTAVAWAGAAFLMFSGLTARQAAAFHLGVSLFFIGCVPALRAVRAPERLAYSLPGALLAVWWLLPFFITEKFLPVMSADNSIFVLCGLMVVIGATWVLMYNADVLLHSIMTAFGRVRWLAPMLKTAVAYPLSSRFRTGITLAMFTLVVFTLVVMSTIISSVNGTINDQHAFGGGYDVRAVTATINPVRDFPSAVRASGLDPARFGDSAALSYIPMKVRQEGVADPEYKDYAVRGLDASFLRDNQYEFALMADGYTSARQVWDAVAANPDLAVVDPMVVPRRYTYGGNMGSIDFKLSGFYLEDNKLPPLRIDLRDEQAGTTRTVTVIGILKDTAPYFLAGISSSQDATAAAYGDRAVPTLHLVKTAPGVNPEDAAKDLESAFLANGMEAAALRADLADLMSTQNAFTLILQGFMGLGLIVGVAALGVISARSVVERRQQIGVLRSLGFQQRMVQLSFLIESSFISLMAIVVGTVLGIIVSFNVVYDFARTPGWEGTGLAVPWMNLAIVFAVVYAASLVATFVPARQASRVFPAEALRYE